MNAVINLIRLNKHYLFNNKIFCLDLLCLVFSLLSIYSYREKKFIVKKMLVGIELKKVGVSKSQFFNYVHF